MTNQFTPLLNTLNPLFGPLLDSFKALTNKKPATPATPTLRSNMSTATPTPPLMSTVAQNQSAATPTATGWHAPMAIPSASSAPSAPIAPPVTNTVPRTGVTTPTGVTINPSTGGVVKTPTPPLPTLPTGTGVGSGAPVAPPVPPEYLKSVSDAEAAYKAAQNLSPEEEAAQRELDTLTESYRTGFMNTGQQAIPLEFITGQQKSLEQRALNLAEPLSAKLARMQAKRMSALDASKFALERADKAGETYRDTEKDKRTEAESARRFDQQQTDTDENQALAEKKFAEDKRQFGLQYALEQQKIANEKTKKSEETTAAEDAKRSQTSQSLSLVNSLLNSDTDAITGVGQNPFNIGGISNSKQINEYNQLKAQLALGARSLLKGSGAVSDYESKVLSDSTSALGRNLPNADFKQALKNIRGVLNSNDGQAVKVSITDPKTGKAKVGELYGADIYSAASQGYIIKYE